MIPSPSIFEPWWWDEVVQAIFQNYLGLITFAVALYVAWRQFVIMDKQTALMEKQDKIIEDDRNRRAKLSIAMEIIPTKIRDKWYKYGFHIVNDGTKMAKDFHWSVYFLEEYLLKEQLEVEFRDSEMVPEALPFSPDDDSPNFKSYRGVFSKPVNPESSATLGYVLLHEDIKTFNIRWHIDAEDGQFPAKHETAAIGSV